MIRNVLEYLEETQKKYPNKIAFANKDTSINFTQLKDFAQKIGSYLLSYNVKNMPIAVMMEKTPMSIAALLGCVYSGNFYTPIDNQMPKDRIVSILDNLCPKVLIVDEKSKKQAENLGYAGSVFLFEDAISCNINNSGLQNVRRAFIDIDPLYVVFTSGSTGVPKGVVINHQAVVNLVEWYTDTLKIDNNDVIGNQAPFYFDSSVKDIYAVLKTGATMEIIPKQHFSFPVKLMEYLELKKISYINWVPSALCIIANMGALEICKPKSLQKIAFVGEIMPTKQYNIWKREYPDALFANIYGPTEATVDCAYYIIDRDFADDELLPIGHACQNTDVFILCDNRLANKGEVGEVCIRGRCLAPGYYNNWEKTNEAFIQNPLNPYYPEKIYKTGDMGKYNEYGEIVFLERKDNQIKHMGHRIELGEIETAINSIDLIEIGCCIYDTDTQKIILFYCGNDATQAYILKKLKDKVPKYMFPNVMILLEEMPYTLNGKIDRISLREYYEDKGLR